MKQSSLRKEYLTKAAKHYHSALPVAEAYLAERGITLEHATAMRLGVVQEPLVGHEQYVNRLAIPYMTRTGVVDIRFRAMDGLEPKYMGLTGATTHMYNVGAFFKANEMLTICEGEIDTITMHAICGIPAVGVPGVNNWKQHYFRLMSDFDRVFMFADGDTAGADFAKFLSKELNNLTVIHLPDSEDVNSMYLKHGAEFFKEKIEKA